MTDTRFDNEREEQYTHRLEAFSDIVIGFSLAQLSLNFVIPSRMSDIYAKPLGLIAFAVTFLVIVIFWSVHHRLFHDYFVPRTDTIVLNFVWLALLLWLVYQLQLVVHFELTADHARAAISYVVTYCAGNAVVVTLLARCMSLRWPRLGPELRRGGIALAGRIGSIAIATAGILGACLALGWNPEYALLGIVVGQLVWAIVWAALRPGIVASA